MHTANDKTNSGGKRTNFETRQNCLEPKPS